MDFSLHLRELPPLTKSRPYEYSQGAKLMISFPFLDENFELDQWRNEGRMCPRYRTHCREPTKGVQNT